MRELKDIRKDITEIDKQMAALFCERMELVKQVAEYKQSYGMPVFDPEREAQVLENGAQRVDDSDMRG
ncbi:MAG: chorismate mutase, partial [Firmicutes bacterium]|nr:chorismate mutase [Bacillota bacterium]